MVPLSGLAGEAPLLDAPSTRHVHLSWGRGSGRKSRPPPDGGPLHRTRSRAGQCVDTAVGDYSLSATTRTGGPGRGTNWGCPTGPLISRRDTRNGSGNRRSGAVSGVSTRNDVGAEGIEPPTTSL